MTLLGKWKYNSRGILPKNFKADALYDTGL